MEEVKKFIQSSFNTFRTASIEFLDRLYSELEVTSTDLDIVRPIKENLRKLVEIAKNTHISVLGSVQAGLVKIFDEIDKISGVDRIEQIERKIAELEKEIQKKESQSASTANKA